MLEALSARHGQSPLDGFCLWLPLTSPFSTLLLICTERHIPMTRDVSGFCRQTEKQVCLGTNFRHLFTILYSGAEGGGRRGDRIGWPGKKTHFCFPNSDSVSITMFWMRYQKVKGVGNLSIIFTSLDFASFFLRKGLCLEHTTFRLKYCADKFRCISFKILHIRKEVPGIGTKPNNN